MPFQFFFKSNRSAWVANSQDATGIYTTLLDIDAKLVPGAKVGATCGVLGQPQIKDIFGFCRFTYVTNSDPNDEENDQTFRMLNMTLHDLT